MELNFGVRRARGSQGVNSLSAIAHLLIPGSPVTDHKILTKDKGIGHKLMVIEMQLGTATEALLEVDPFASRVANDLDLFVLDWEIQCTMNEKFEARSKTVKDFLGSADAAGNETDEDGDEQQAEAEHIEKLMVNQCQTE